MQYEDNNEHDPMFDEPPYKEFLKEVQYLYDEGFIYAEFNPDHPNDLRYASLRSKSDEEIEDEIQMILNS
jgi:hypothetical protein